MITCKKCGKKFAKPWQVGAHVRLEHKKGQVEIDPLTFLDSLDAIGIRQQIVELERKRATLLRLLRVLGEEAEGITRPTTQNAEQLCDR